MEWIYDRRKEKGLKMVDKRTWGSPPPTNRTKIHLHLGQFSRKTNWNLHKNSYKIKAARKIPMELGRIGEKY